MDTYKKWMSVALQPQDKKLIHMDGIHKNKTKPRVNNLIVISIIQV